MLAAVGVGSLEELIERTVPAAIRSERTLALPPARTEAGALAALRAMAGRNRVATSLIGMGYYGTHTPPVILRNVLENPGWYTAYTPYQAEVSQGRLEARAQLPADGGRPDRHGAGQRLAARRGHRRRRGHGHGPPRPAQRSRDRFFADARCHPQTLAVLHTRARHLGIELVTGDAWAEAAGQDLFGVLVQYPGGDGAIRDPRPVIEAVHAQGGLACVATDLLALTLLTPPGELGADIVLGSAQRFGVPMGYGGPHAAFFATKDAHKRAMPGRIIGVSVDARGRPALRMALQTREQHIRRDKATSNICTAQVLLAVMSGFYAVWHGPEGLTRIARRVHGLTALLARALPELGIEVANTQLLRHADPGGPRPRPRPADRRPRRRPQPAPRRRGPSGPVARRDHHAAATCAGSWPPWAPRPPASPTLMERRLRRRLHPHGPAAHLALPHPPRVRPPPQRDRDAALPAPPPGQGHRPRPRDDPARLLHHEAQRHGRDAPRHLARVRQPPPVRAARTRPPATRPCSTTSRPG